MKIISLVPSGSTFVDDEDYDFLTSIGAWNSSKGYPAHWDKNKRYPIMMHDLIAARKGIHGLIDHRDRNPMNNTRNNLRPADKSQNGINAKLSGANTSGFKGVARSGKRWRAYITINKRQLSLGFFASREEAAQARKTAERRIFGEFST